MKLIKKIISLPHALLIVILMRLLRPLFLIRVGVLIADRIGHFVGNVEIYLCEKNAKINQPKKPYVDIFFMSECDICNPQIAKIWKRILHIWPSWILAPAYALNKKIPFGAAHEIGNNSFHDKDVFGLLESQPRNINLTSGEIKKGELEMVKMGLPLNAQFICLSVRDSAYLSAEKWSYHSYRDSDINNYVMAAEELAARGYYVIRMGASVNARMPTSNPFIIDYATNGMRSAFMDVYLGAKCLLCISSGNGWDSIPVAFRRPVAYANYAAIAFQYTVEKVFLAITKHHYSTKKKEFISIDEIVKTGVGYAFNSKDYLDEGIVLIENSPEEILDLTVEALERVNNNWIETKEDNELQKKFLSYLPSDKVADLNGNFLKPNIDSRVGKSFLRNSGIMPR